MGYTHYWEFKGKTAPKDLQDGENKFAKVAEIVKVCLKKVTDKGIGIGAGSGNGGTPKISKTAIVFNGVGEGSCETFFVHSDDGEWNFCKTGENPMTFSSALPFSPSRRFSGMTSPTARTG